MQVLLDFALKFSAELIVLSLINLLPFRRLKSIEKTLKGLRRDLRRARRVTARHRGRLDDHERRIDCHDAALNLDTRAPAKEDA